jgi:molybdate transport system permease protein
MTWAPLDLSLQIAAVATLLALAVGIAVALLIGWRRLPAPNAINALVLAPLVLPPTVLGYYLLVALGPDSALGRAWYWLTGSQIAFTFTGAVIAATVGSLPLVINAIRVGLDAIDPTLLAAARTLGASPARVLATITLPLAAPGIIAGAMLGFARALGDYGMTQMLAGTRIDGLGVRVTSPVAIYTFDQLVQGNEGATRAMALATTALGVCLLYFATRLTRRLHPHRA